MGFRVHCMKMVVFNGFPRSQPENGDFQWVSASTAPARRGGHRKQVGEHPEAVGMVNDDGNRGSAQR
jgi:hypothetical protein